MAHGIKALGRVIMDIFVDNSIELHDEKKKLIEKILGLLPENDINGIDSIYIIPKIKKVEIFKGLRTQYDPYYVRRSKNGKPAIVISEESIRAKKKSRIYRYFLVCSLPVLLIIAIIPLTIWCIRDKNFKFWYILGENQIKRKKINAVVGRELLRLINYILFYIGIHKAFDIFSSDELYLNINMYEFATKYLNSKIEYILTDSAIQKLA